jgi:DNA-binding NarL/FixJ family response regulator
MNKNLNILIVDDHPMLVDGYCLIFNNLMDGYSFNIYCAYNCEEAYKIINQNSKLKNEIDIALLDVSLPPYKEEKIFCGGDLAIVFKDRFPSSKVVMITMHDEGIIIDKIVSKVNPEGFLNKSDISFETFSEVFETILSGEKFFTETINKSLKELNNKKFGFDSIDYEIISLLEKGIKTKDLPNYIPITLSAIEKRKVKIKFQVLNHSGNDDELIKKVKDLNLL